MELKVSHNRNEETIEAKARWFQSLTIEQRIEVFNSFVNLALFLNPNLPNLKDARPVKGRIQILSK
jgi:hypothetical protein